jgi:hypothetical protein
VEAIVSGICFAPGGWRTPQKVDRAGQAWVRGDGDRLLGGGEGRPQASPAPCQHLQPPSNAATSTAQRALR